MSLLELFAETGALLTIATTHHGELKTLKYRYLVSCKDPCRSKDQADVLITPNLSYLTCLV